MCFLSLMCQFLILFFGQLILEEIVGFTTENANGLASGVSNSKCVYIAGCVAVVYDVDSSTQSHLVVSNRLPKPLSCVAVSCDGLFIAAGEVWNLFSTWRIFPICGFVWNMKVLRSSLFVILIETWKFGGFVYLCIFFVLHFVVWRDQNDVVI